MRALPAGFDKLAPGPVLALFLSSVETESLSGFDRVTVLRAHQRLVSYFQARVIDDIASISDLMNQLEPDPEIAHDAAAPEIGAALRLTRRTAESDLDLAIDLKGRLPEVWEALASGKIDLRKAQVIVEGTSHLSEAAAREVVGRILEAATRLTTGQLRALIRKVCVQADPDDAKSRYQEAVEGRRIEVQPSVDGTAHLLGLDLPPDRAAAAMRRIADLARGLKTAHETRTIDQIRADVFLELLDGKHFTLTHPDSRQVIDNGITRRRPTTAQRRHVEARNRHCVFPGCRKPSVDCDLDHGRPWAHGGPTTERNLAPLCRHNHGTKHRCGWTYRRLPNGDYLWTSRLGHTYTTSGLPP